MFFKWNEVSKTCAISSTDSLSLRALIPFLTLHKGIRARDWGNLMLLRAHHLVKKHPEEKIQFALVYSVSFSVFRSKLSAKFKHHQSQLLFLTQINGSELGGDVIQ